jgi:filamentous hemagglutinin family protein
VILPTGSTLGSGTATVTTSGSTLTINQTSAKAILNWSAFSIGAGGTVQFNNGTGATLNRVTGATLSQIDGTLSGTGSVYLINPNGVVIGKSGVINVGGRFVASAQALSDAAFLAGGDLTFSGASTATVINYGKVGSSGGDVVLIASKVENDGSITAANGAVGLLAGTKILLRDQALDSGRFAVQAGGAATSATNSGAVTAAEVELRANGGNVYALAGNATGVIAATGVGALDGKVYLVADGGTASIAGKITARAKGGVGGLVETSGKTVQIGAASIDAGKGGQWLIDPSDLTIDQTAANAISTTLNAGTAVVEQTSAPTAGGSGDITIGNGVNLRWTTNAALTFSAYRNVSVGNLAIISSTGGGAVTLRADNTGDGSGTVVLGGGAGIWTQGQVKIFYNPRSYSDLATASFASGVNPFAQAMSGPGTGTSPLTAYMLVNNVDQLQAINTNLNGVYALGGVITATATANWNGGAGFVPIGYIAQNQANPFTGILDGTFGRIDNLTINQGIHDAATGLFAVLGQNSSVLNLEFTGAHVTGGGSVGVLAGAAVGANVLNVKVDQVSSSVTGLTSGGVGGYSVGGLIGYARDSTINSVSFFGTVSGYYDVGGLIGDMNGSTTLTSSNAFTTTVTGVGGSSQNIGGAVGEVEYGTTVQKVYTNFGGVTGGISVGGLAGENSGTISGSGSNQVVGRIVNVQGVQNVGGLVGWSDGTVSASYGNDTVTQTGSAGGAGGLIGWMNGGTVTNSIGYAAVTGVTDVGGLIGRVVFGSVTGSSATGNVTSATANGGGIGGGNAGGLIGTNSGAVFQSYATGDVQGGGNDGGLVGQNNDAGTIDQSFATGTVTGSSVYGVGGLVGYNRGAVSNSYASGDVFTQFASAGGLIGFNVGSSSTSYSLGIVTGNIADGTLGAGAPTGSTVYWDVDTSGIKDFTSTFSGLPTRGLTTQQMTTSLPSGFSSSIWSIIPGSSMPYLKWQFGGATPITFTGNVQDASGNGLAGREVDMLASGSVAAHASSFSGGYFYFLLAPTATNGGNVTLFLKNAPEKATTVLEDFGGSESGVQLKAGSLILAGAYDVTTLSQLFASAKQSIGLYSDPGLLFMPADGVVAGTPVTIFSLGSTFNIDKTIDTGAAALTIEEQGAVTEGANVSVNTGQLILHGYGSGTFNLFTGQNHIAAVSGDAASLILGDVLDNTNTGLLIDSAGGGNGFSTTGALVIDTKRSVSQAAGTTVNAGGLLRLIAGSLSLGQVNAGGNVTIATNTGDLSFQGLFNAVGNVSLYSTGRITEGPQGQIYAASLGGFSVGGMVLNNGNGIQALWDFTNTGGGGITLHDVLDIHQSGVLSAGSGALNLISSGNIYLTGNVSAGGTFVMNAGGLIYQAPRGGITAAALSGFAQGGVSLMGPNAIGSLGNFTNSGGGNFYFNDTGALNVTGSVSTANGVLELISGGALNVSGSASAGNNNLLLVSGGAITLGGALSAGQSAGNFAYLSAHGAVTETTGGVNAYALEGSSIGGANLSGANHLHSLWAWTNVGAGGFTLNATGGDLHVTGAISAGTGTLALTDLTGELLLQADLSAGSAVSLKTSTDIRQTTGVITTSTLNADAASYISLPSHNAIAHMGVVNSGSGQITIN